MTRTPPKPPIVQRLEARRAVQPVSPSDRSGRDRRGDFDLMFWCCVVVAVAGLYALLTLGGVR